MDRSDRIAEVLGHWREKAESGFRMNVDALVACNPEIAQSLRAHFEAQELVEQYFDQETLNDHLAPPPSLGDYRIVKEIGRGGMGVVYAAEQISMGRSVALKVLFPTIASTRRTQKRFEREARVTGRLHHTNIVTVHGMGHEGGYLYFAMELVRGEPLDRVITQLRALRDGDVVASVGVAGSLHGRRGFRRIAEMFAGVADALHVAHGQGVIHRDVKPSNLVLDEDDVLKLTDFGLAHLAGESFGVTRTGEMIGTPLYMSPEQVRARREDVDLRTDVYSLGATLYEMLARERPHDGSDVGTLCSQILAQEPRPLREIDARIPRDLATIVHKAMEKERADRYASAGAMARDLRAFGEGRSIQARPVGLGRRIWRRTRRHKVRSALIAAVLVLVPVAGVFASRASRERERRVQEETRGGDREYEDLLASAQEEWPPLPHLGKPESNPISRAVVLRPDRPDAYLLRSFQGRRTHQERLADLDAAAERGLSPRTLHLARAWHFCAMRRNEEAEREFVEAQRHTQSSGLDGLLEAEIASHQGRREEAIAVYHRVMAAKPEERPLVNRAAFQLARLYEAAGDLNRALEYLSSASDADERGIVDFLHLASLWDRLDRQAEAEQKLDTLLAAMGPKEDLVHWVALLKEAETHCRPAWITKIAGAGLGQHPNSSQLHYWKAMGLRRGHRPEEALKVLTRAEALARPDAPQELGPIRHMRAKVLMNLGKINEAVEDAHSATEFLPGVDGPLATYAEALIVAGRVAEALEPAQRAVACGPGTYWAHHTLAKACLANRDVPGALRALADAHRIAPGQTDVARQYAQLLAAGRRTDEALGVLEPALETHPADTELQSEKYWILARAGRKAEAQAVAEEVLDRADGVLAASPDSASHHALRGVALMWLGKPPEALEAYKASVRLDASSSKTWFNYAYAYGQLGRKEDEEKAYREALELNPQYAAAWGNLAGVLLERGEFEEALEASVHVLRSTADPQWLHQAHHNRGICLTRMARYDDAVRALESALVYQPGDPESLGGIADARYQQKHFDAAASAYERAVAADPSHEGRWVSWSMALILQQRFEEALDVLNRGIESHPKSNDMNANRVVLLYKNPQLPGVVPALEAWVAAAPRSRQAWALKAQFHLGRKEHDLVIECAGQALAIAPDDPSAFESRARAYAAKKDYEAALADYEKMLPRAGKYAGGVMNFAWFLTTCPDPKVRDAGRAAVLADKGLKGLASEGRSHPNAWLMAGWSRLRAGLAPASALEALRRYLELVRDDADGTCFYGMAAALARAGDIEEARDWFKKAEAWAGEHPAEKEDLAPFRADAHAALEGATK